jgi:hypothetical protein
VRGLLFPCHLLYRLTKGELKKEVNKSAGRGTTNLLRGEGEEEVEEEEEGRGEGERMSSLRTCGCCAEARD